MLWLVEKETVVEACSGYERMQMLVEPVEGVVEEHLSRDLEASRGCGGPSLDPRVHGLGQETHYLE